MCSDSTRSRYLSCQCMGWLQLYPELRAIACCEFDKLRLSHHLNVKCASKCNVCELSQGLKGIVFEQETMPRHVNGFNTVDWAEAFHVSVMCIGHVWRRYLLRFSIQGLKLLPPIWHYPLARLLPLSCRQMIPSRLSLPLGRTGPENRGTFAMAVWMAGLFSRNVFLKLRHSEILNTV